MITTRILIIRMGMRMIMVFGVIVPVFVRVRVLAPAVRVLVVIDSMVVR